MPAKSNDRCVLALKRLNNGFCFGVIDCFSVNVFGQRACAIDSRDAGDSVLARLEESFGDEFSDVAPAYASRFIRANPSG